MNRISSLPTWWKTAVPVLRVLAALPLAFSCLTTRSAEPVTRIALGSCADQDKPQPIWEAVVARSPQLFLFLGDNVYADTEDPTEMRKAYAKLAAIPGYRKLQAACPVLAIWDDHDYGVNDGGADYRMRAEAEKVFEEFFAIPADAPSRGRPGIHDSRLFDGGEGRRLQILMLDTRYFRGPLIALPERSEHGPYDRNPDPGATMLGEAQWDWLAAELAKPADLRLILTSIQFLPQDHRWECWENFPHERSRLLKLLEKAKTGPVLFLSGDRHMGEIMELKTDAPDSPGFPVYEKTSSGLTNAGGGRPDEPNRHRVAGATFRERNFGMVRIDWERGVAFLELHDLSGAVVRSHEAGFRTAGRP
jgi:alkaline phosphatase D